MDFGQQPVVTRFAPSPNGYLHLGHAYAAICAHDFARANGGSFLLRIEDIDGTRSRAEFVEAILADLDWLGLEHDGAVVYQSRRVKFYRAALDRLKALGLVYCCVCSRSQTAAAIRERPVRRGPDGPHYPGTCRGKNLPESEETCWRLDMAKATEITGPLVWRDLASGEQRADPGLFGDIVLWRKDAPASYHLAATLDDAADAVSVVVRGQDLLAYTHIHRLLQALLDLSTPLYWHHALLLDDTGEKLAKSKRSPSLSALRKNGEDGRHIADQLRLGQLPLGIGLSKA